MSITRTTLENRLAEEKQRQAKVRLENEAYALGICVSCGRKMDSISFDDEFGNMRVCRNSTCVRFSPLEPLKAGLLARFLRL